jgi:membrane-bound serine protease (ClpP class)
MCRPCTSIGHRTQARQRALWLVLLCIVCGAAMAAPRQAAVVGEIRLLSLDGVINPLTARYLERGLRQAADAGAQLVVVRLDTPGGLESSMRQMTQSLLSSPVPVAVYVAPPGARAASAGMFLTLAAHIAAMAPGTNIGAAHPVGLGGQVDEVMVEKLVQDAAALARSVAAERGRNTGWAERAVRKSVSISAHEALEQGVIDLIPSPNVR